MAGVKIVLNDAGIRSVLNGPEVRKIITEKASQIAQRAGSGYAYSDPHFTGQRAAVNIYPASAEAAKDNYENNTLKKELYR